MSANPAMRAQAEQLPPPEDRVVPLLERAARLIWKGMNASDDEPGAREEFDVKRVVELLNLMGEGFKVSVRRVEVSGGHGAEDELRSIPDGFRRAYGELVSQVYGAYTSPSGDLVGQAELGRAIGKGSGARLSSAGVEYRGGARAKGRQRGAGGIDLRNERALRFKKKMDRKLRHMKHEIELFLDGSTLALYGFRCSKCGKVGEAEWKYCPRCAGLMVDSEK